MGLNGNHEFIMQNSKDNIFNFFLNEKDDITCIASNQQRQWVSKEDVFPKRCNSLDIDLDSKDHFHIVSYHYDGDLYYHHKSKDRWKNIQLTRLNRTERTFYPRIKTVDNTIHVFYDLQQTNERDRCTLYHYTYHEKEMKWIKNNVCTIRFNKFVNPYKILTYKNQIYLLYISIINNYEEVFIIQYDSIKDQWNKPIQLTTSSDRKLYLDGLLDNNGNIHISWCQYLEQEGLIVKYLKCKINNLGKNKESILSLSDRLNCSFPQLIQFNETLYCMWVQFSHLYVSQSVDSGIIWNTPTVVPESKMNNFKRYRYANNHLLYKNTIVCDFLYGTHYPSIQFLGFGGGQHDEVSTNKS